MTWSISVLSPSYGREEADLIAVAQRVSLFLDDAVDEDDLDMPIWQVQLLQQLPDRRALWQLDGHRLSDVQLWEVATKGGKQLGLNGYHVAALTPV